MLLQVICVKFLREYVFVNLLFKNHFNNTIEYVRMVFTCLNSWSYKLFLNCVRMKKNMNDLVIYKSSS